MRRILCSDWPPERARWSDTAHPGLLVQPLEFYEQTPQKLLLRITFQISKNDLLTEVTPAQTLIENLLSDIKFTEKESALL